MTFQVSAVSDLFDGRAPYNGCALQPVARPTIAPIDCSAPALPSKTHRTHSTAFSCPSSSRRLRAALTSDANAAAPSLGHRAPRNRAHHFAPRAQRSRTHKLSRHPRLQGWRAVLGLGSQSRIAPLYPQRATRPGTGQAAGSDRRPARHAHGSAPPRQRLQVPRAEYPILKTCLSLY
jgi:hypothetical protein